MQRFSLPMTSATSKSVQYLTAKAARWLQQTMPITSQNWATGKKYNSECIHQIAKLQRITVNNCVRFFRGHVVAQNQKRWAVKGFIMSTTQIPVPILVKSNGTTEGWICWVHPFYSTCASRDKSLLKSQKSQNDSWKSTPQLENKRLADLPFPLLPSCHAWSLGTSTKHNQAYRTTEHWTSTDIHIVLSKKSFKNSEHSMVHNHPSPTVQNNFQLCATSASYICQMYNIIYSLLSAFHSHLLITTQMECILATVSCFWRIGSIGAVFYQCF